MAETAHVRAEGNRIVDPIANERHEACTPYMDLLYRTTITWKLNREPIANLVARLEHGGQSQVALGCRGEDGPCNRVALSLLGRSRDTQDLGAC
jgi:hypothetical protein